MRNRTSALSPPEGRVIGIEFTVYHRDRAKDGSSPLREYDAHLEQLERAVAAQLRSHPRSRDLLETSAWFETKELRLPTRGEQPQFVEQLLSFIPTQLHRLFPCPRLIAPNLSPPLNTGH